MSSGSTPPSRCRPRPAPPRTEPITGFNWRRNVPNEENTEDGIIYQNSIGLPAANARGWYGHRGRYSSRQRPSTSTRPVSSAASGTTPRTTTRSATNIAEQRVDAAVPRANTMGNFLAGTLSMATMRSTAGSGEAYVDLTTQLGRFNQDTNRGLRASTARPWRRPTSGTTTSPRASDPSDSTSTIPGIRYVYNVADTVLPGYNGAKMLIGFDNQASGTESVLCHGDDASTITAQGFLPLTNGSGAVGLDPSGSFCREFPGLSFPGQGGTLSWTVARPSTAEAPKRVLAPVVWAARPRPLAGTATRSTTKVARPPPHMRSSTNER